MKPKTETSGIKKKKNPKLTMKKQDTIIEQKLQKKSR